MGRLLSGCFLFDADGVITEVSTHKANKEVLNTILGIISEGTPVAIITGRSMEWLKKEILNPFEDIASNRSAFANFFASAEFGGIHLEFKGENEIVKKEEGISPPSKIKEEAEGMFQNYKRSMWIEPKDTLITFACKINHPIEEYREDQISFASKLQNMLDRHGLQNEYEVQSDLLGLNIRNRKVNKSFATKEVLRWLADKKINPDHFIAIGDSQSDTEIAQELQDNYSTEFVFVGNPKSLDRSSLHCPVIVTNEKFERGTLEYLRSLI